MRSWGARTWSAAVGAGLATALVTGLPTEMIANPWFSRMVPATWWSRPVWALTAVLTGLLAATYVRRPVEAGTDRSVRRGGIGGVLGYLAIGCPVCNKLVVLALGTSGAMTWFAPLQPLLAVGAVVLLSIALRARLRNVDACPTTVRSALR